MVVVCLCLLNGEIGWGILCKVFVWFGMLCWINLLLCCGGMLLNC